MQNLLYLLPLLVCPIAMGLIMWMMMRRSTGQGGGPVQTPGKGPEAVRSTGTNEDEAVGRLRARLNEIEAEQAKIAAQITRLTTIGRSPETHSAAQAESDKAASVPGRQPDQAGGAVDVGAAAYGEMAVEQKRPGA